MVTRFSRHSSVDLSSPINYGPGLNPEHIIYLRFVFSNLHLNYNAKR